MNIAYGEVPIASPYFTYKNYPANEMAQEDKRNRGLALLYAISQQ